MRTTVRLDPHPLSEAKTYAAETGKTLTAVRALRESLSRRRERPAARPLRLKTCKGSGLRAGVDLKLVADAWLAAMAIEAGCAWVTTDRDFSRFEGLRWRHPLR